MQLSAIIGLFGLMLELVEFTETYKIMKPYKYYNPHPWHHRPPQWHSYSKPRKLYHPSPKRGPSYKYHHYEPDHERYAPHYEDSYDAYEDDKPYIIVIQLPRKKEKSKYHPHAYKRQHNIDDPPPDDDYIDDEEDKLEVHDLSNKTVQIKITPTDSNCQLKMARIMSRNVLQTLL